MTGHKNSSSFAFFHHTLSKSPPVVLPLQSPSWKTDASHCFQSEALAHPPHHSVFEVFLLLPSAFQLLRCPTGLVLCVLPSVQLYSNKGYWCAGEIPILVAFNFQWVCCYWKETWQGNLTAAFAFRHSLKESTKPFFLKIETLLKTISFFTVLE